MYIRSDGQIQIPVFVEIVNFLLKNTGLQIMQYKSPVVAIATYGFSGQHAEKILYSSIWSDLKANLNNNQIKSN